MNYNMEQPTGYPHRPPSLRLESRRTSISMDDVVPSSSPDSNLLRVQATLPGRRHSDNTIQPPRILVAPCSPEGTVSYTPGGLPVRRHSSVGTQDSRFSGFFTSPKMASPNLGVDFFSSSRANGSQEHADKGTHDSIPSRRDCEERQNKNSRCRSICAPPSLLSPPRTSCSVPASHPAPPSAAQGRITDDAPLAEVSALAEVLVAAVSPIAAVSVTEVPGFLEVGVLALPVAEVFATQVAGGIEVAFASHLEAAPAAAPNPFAGRQQRHSGVSTDGPGRRSVAETNLLSTALVLVNLPAVRLAE
ncbi:hypothetical protein HPB48_006398 [Haemaphysalis longicornis]|uniref:Uncharacterized protein n=1 Tax=Haemaphysalis longicornis TaxID=44386 RepID=A0A9J6FMQ9_HAELO|nr:hypothetical protein HPB48_006398 [Haemaphysalis longicornis]